MFKLQLCQQICYDSSASNCTVYNYYDMNHVESPGLCVLLKSCDQVVSTTCEGCHLGPRACAKQGGQCGFAMWSTSMSGVVMETSNSRLRLMSGEPGCSREVVRQNNKYEIRKLAKIDRHEEFVAADFYM